MILFTYDFPHKKTLDFIFYCRHYGYDIEAVIAAPKVKLPIPKRKYKAGVNLNIGVIPTVDICKSMDIPYHVIPHNDSVELLQDLQPEVGLIAGARILSKDVINCFRKGIINFHPGGIPEARGLDTPRWIVYDDLPVAVTSHFIDPRVDGGWIIKRLDMEVEPNDTLKDIGLKLYLGQLEIFEETMKIAINSSMNHNELELVSNDAKPSYKYFPSELEEELKYIGAHL